MTERKIVIPGEVIVEGNDFLPGEETEKRKEGIVSLRFGLAEENRKLVKVIPLSGIYQPRKGNTVIGKVENVFFNGWIIDLDIPQTAFLTLSEIPRFVNRKDIEEVIDIGDMIVAKIVGISKKGIDLSIKGRGLGKLEEGIIIKVNSNKVPRVIGKEGSMINLIKKETKCKIIVGQNGFIWIEGNKVEDELLAKKAILHVTEKSFVSGLTDEMKKWFEKEKGEK